jgi:hypothetical protein
VKADTLSSLYDTEERQGEETPIISQCCIITPMVWDVEVDIRQALYTEPARAEPGEPCLRAHRCVVQPPFLGAHCICVESSWDRTYHHLPNEEVLVAQLGSGRLGLFLLHLCSV